MSTRSRRPEEQRQRDDGEQREQRGRGATCTHRPADETKSSEGQDSVAARGTTRGAMFLPRLGSSTTERSTSSGGGARRTKSNENQKLRDGGDRSNHLVAPPRVIALDDADEMRVGQCHIQ